MIINCLNRLDDELLIETYLAATKLKDSKDFVELLKNEICRRGLKDNKLFQKKFKLKLWCVKAILYRNGFLRSVEGGITNLVIEPGGDNSGRDQAVQL